MKKIIFTSLLLAAPFCKAADPAAITEYVAEADPDVWVGLVHYLTQCSSYYAKIYTVRLFAYLELDGGHHLDLKGHQLTEVPNNPNLPEVGSISFSNNQIEAIANLNLPPNLRWLWMANNLITAIPNDLPDLEVLSLNDNHIKSIANLSIPSLRRLELNNNQLRALPNDLNLPELRYLELQNNQIDFINEEVLDQFPNLRWLFLNENYLTVFQETQRYILVQLSYSFYMNLLNLLPSLYWAIVIINFIC